MNCGCGKQRSHNIEKLWASEDKLRGLLMSIRHQAIERLEDGHGYTLMLSSIIIEINGVLEGVDPYVEYDE